jgi:hypothetical protein
MRLAHRANVSSSVRFLFGQAHFKGRFLVPTASKTAISCGYYTLDKFKYGQHTFGRAKPEKVKFKCYGGVGGKSSKGLVDPADFLGAEALAPEEQGQDAFGQSRPGEIHRRQRLQRLVVTHGLRPEDRWDR